MLQGMNEISLQTKKPVSIWPSFEVIIFVIPDCHHVDLYQHQDLDKMAAGLRKTLQVNKRFIFNMNFTDVSFLKTQWINIYRVIHVSEICLTLKAMVNLTGAGKVVWLTQSAHLLLYWD